MKSKILAILLIFAVVLTMSACGGETGTELSADTAAPAGTAEEEVTEENVLSKMQKNYTMTSLTESWSSDLTVQEDGSFEGTYHTDLEDGSYMYVYTGSFSGPSRIDNHRFSLKLDSAVVKSAEEAGEPENGAQYSETDTAEGFAGTEEFYLFLPGTTMSEISESASEDSLFAMGYSATDTLDCYVLVNPATRQAFAGTD